MKNRKRIVRDNFHGYKVEIKFWWFPFIWFEYCFMNSHSTMEDAREFAKKKKVVEEIK